ncbi:hypothetical protein MKK69_18745 [Methylobacterium sp. J-026]|uniref:hypothetical protein n=1 Tax=Methylobacterium sp. J-026 TaxID=2836624 RepID=UPI001FBA54C1|nr:hypothetical protein [Methylobacterium sp. J-026]MCJ2136062.1 hypothetical protein [Methylobacterium sp. J-026]
MKPLLSNWTIVLAGRWNMEILNPEWVTNSIFGREKVDIDLVLQGMQANIRYRFDNLVFVPRPHNVVFSVNDTKDSSLLAIEEAAGRLLEALPVTPITALGINFTYIEENPTTELLTVFNIDDASRIADYGMKIRSARVRRELDFEDRQLNMMVSQIEDGSVRIALNYHLAVDETQVALSALAGRLVHYRQHGEAFLSAIYGLEIEGPADE